MRVGGAMSNIEDRRTEVFFSNPEPSQHPVGFCPPTSVAIRSVKGLSDEIFILPGWTILNMSRSYISLRLLAASR